MISLDLHSRRAAAAGAAHQRIFLQDFYEIRVYTRPDIFETLNPP
jgi:hypothetical protein